MNSITDNYNDYNKHNNNSHNYNIDNDHIDNICKYDKNNIDDDYDNISHSNNNSDFSLAIKDDSDQINKPCSNFLILNELKKNRFKTVEKLVNKKFNSDLIYKKLKLRLNHIVNFYI